MIRGRGRRSGGRTSSHGGGWSNNALNGNLGVRTSINLRRGKRDKLPVGTRKHQSTRIGGFKCQIRIFPGDLSIVQGFCEV
jgi:hypothetical protein